MIDGPSVQADSAAPARARVDLTRNSHHLNFDSPPILLKDNVDDNVIILNFMSNNIWTGFFNISSTELSTK